VKERPKTIEKRKKYLPNYVRYSDKLAHDLPGRERLCTQPSKETKRNFQFFFSWGSSTTESQTDFPCIIMCVPVVEGPFWPGL
jgi:hypothetical protein